ncbi:MAG: polysaccharide biosynthesis protein [Lachnospiraceae bacterium]|nr:polysaccharide biosynthesis protein [Lachnospiraceae bacterium]
MSPKKKNFIVQAAILSVAGILVRIIGLLYRNPLNAAITDVGYGYYQSAYAIYAMILLISSYSIPTAVSKVISAKLALKEYKNAHRIFHVSLIYVVIVGGIAALITFIFAPVLIDRPGAVLALRVLAPTIFFSGILGVFRGYFQAYNTMVQTSISQIIEQIFNAVASIAAAYALIAAFASSNTNSISKYGAAGGAAGTGIGVLAGLLFMVLVYMLNRRIILKKVYRDKTRKLDSYKDIFIVIFSMVTPVILSTFIYNISTALDMTIFFKIAEQMPHMTKNLADIQYGVFSGKYMILINVPVAIASALSSAVIPTVSSRFALEDYEGASQKVGQALHFTMLIAIPSAIGLAVLAYPIMELLFPSKDTLALAADMLTTGSISVIFYSMSTVSNGILQGIGKVTIPVRNAFIALVIHVIALVAMLEYTDWGIYSLMLATILYSFLMCILNGISVRHHLQYRHDFGKLIIRPFIAAIVMGSAAFLTFYSIDTLIHSAKLALFPAIIVALPVYFVAIIKTGGINEEELLNFPKGATLLRISKRMHLL